MSNLTIIIAIAAPLGVFALGYALGYSAGVLRSFAARDKRSPEKEIECGDCMRPLSLCVCESAFDQKS